MLKKGDEAPDFELKTDEGTLVKLSDFKEKKVVLYFYPKDDTPGCTAEACNLRDNYSQFQKKGVVVLGISKDDEKKHKKFKEKYNLPFPLLADTDGEVCKKYGVWGPKKFMGLSFTGIIRTTFIINKGIIEEVITNIKTKTHGEDLLKIV